MDKSTKTNISIRIGTETLSYLQKIAVTQRRKTTELIRLICEDYVNSVVK